MNKIDVTEVDNDEKTLLHHSFANKKNALNIVEYLISINKIDLGAKDKEKRTVLFYACKDGNLDMFQLLQKSYEFDYNDKDKYGKTILHYACATNNFDLVKTLISLGAITTVKDAKDSTILHCACENGNLDIVKFLVNLGKFNINEKDKTRKTPYKYALDSGNENLIKYLEDLPGIDLTKPNENEVSNDDEISLNLNILEEKELNTINCSKLIGSDNVIKDGKSQFEYGKKLLLEAIKYLKMSKQNGYEEGSEFFEKFIRYTDIGEDENENKESE